MNVTTIPASRGARHRRKRVGRGIGSGHGKTATRGTKGQRARTGSRKRPGFEGGRTPLIRATPKRGFKQKATGRAEPMSIVNVGRLNALGNGEAVDPIRMSQLGIIRSRSARVKLLGNGELSRKLTVSVHAASASAKEKIEKAGGRLQLLSKAPAS
jgi:large subunit ribosomal protein L15